MSAVRQGRDARGVTGNPTLLFAGVCGTRPHLYDLTVEEDRSFIIEGLISSNSPSEHCLDCLGLAANAPYSKPGVKFSGLPPLPTVPRRGDTQCLANCKCFLTFVDSVGKAVDPGDRPGTTAVKGEDDGDDREPVDSAERAIAQKKADALQQEMQYAKAMYEQTGDREWLKKRKAANEAMIDLQNETGLTFVPNAPAGKMAELANEAKANGWTPGLAADSAKFTQGQTAAVVHGTEFSRGRLATWDAQAGRGTMELLDGRQIMVGTADNVPTIMFGKSVPAIPPKPGAIELPADRPNAVAYDVPGRSNVVVDVPPKTAAVPPDRVPAAKAVTDALKARPQEEAHGLNVWLMEEKQRTKPLEPDTRKRFGAVGVEIVPQRNVIAIRGVGSMKPDAIKEATWAGVGAKLYRDRLTGGTRGAELTAALRKARRGLETRGAGLFINGTAEERLFGTAYMVFVAAPESLKADAPALFDLIRDVLEDIESEFAGV